MGLKQAAPAYEYVYTKLFANKKLQNDWEKVIRRAPANKRVLTSTRLLDAIVACYACRPPPPVAARAEIESRYAAFNEAARLLQEAFPGPPTVTVRGTHEVEGGYYEEDAAPDDVPKEVRAALDAINVQSKLGLSLSPPESLSHQYYWEKWTLIPDALRAARKHLKIVNTDSV